MPLAPARPRLLLIALAAAWIAAMASTAAVADTARLVLLADGEALATEGFLAPRLSRDGWELRFSSVRATLANVVAHQTEPPYDATSGAAIDGTVSVRLLEGPLTVDLTAVDAGGLVTVAAVDAPVGFYNALAWDLVPGADGTSLLLSGSARRADHHVEFRIHTGDAVRHRCGEFIGDARLGVLREGGSAELQVTFHLDHLFGRADKPADDGVNLQAPGFDPFSDGGDQHLSLDGLHIGHVGEGHCHVEPL